MTCDISLAHTPHCTGSRPLHPLAFLTNGGGVTEAAKAAELSGWLGVAVGADQVGGW